METTHFSPEEHRSPEIHDELARFENSLEVQPKPTYQCKTWEEYEKKKREYDKEINLYTHKLEVYNYMRATQHIGKTEKAIDAGLLVLHKHCLISGTSLYCMGKKYTILFNKAIKKEENKDGIVLDYLTPYFDSIMPFLSWYGQDQGFILTKEADIWGLKKHKNDAYIVTQQDVKDGILPQIEGFSIYKISKPGIFVSSSRSDNNYLLIPYFKKPTPPLLPQPIPPKTPKSADKKPIVSKKTPVPRSKEEPNTPLPIDTTTSRQKTRTHTYNIGGTVTKEGVTGGTRVTKSVYDLYTIRYSEERTKGRSYEDFQKNYLPKYLKN